MRTFKHSVGRSRAMGWLLAAATGMSAAGTVWSQQAPAQQAPTQAAQTQQSQGPEGTKWHHGARAGDAQAGLFPFFGRHLTRALDEVHATPEQRTRIKAIVQAAGQDLKAMHEGGRDLRSQALTLFGQPQVDAAAAEQLRQQMVARHDAVSKRMLQAALDVAKELTPQQRAQWVAQMQKRHAKSAAMPH